MAVGVPTCPNCGSMVWPEVRDLYAEEQTWRCSSCNATGTVNTLAEEY